MNELLGLLTYFFRDKPIARSRTPWIAVELYRHFGYFSLGAISCLLFTEIAKYTIGRLRPHFLTVCNPEFTSQLCQVENHYNNEKVGRGDSEGD